jgi:hypothetical protein
MAAATNQGKRSVDNDHQSAARSSHQQLRGRHVAAFSCELEKLLSLLLLDILPETLYSSVRPTLF